MESYIVRIYRRGQTPEDIVGVVERPEYEQHLRFRSLAELNAILATGECEADGEPPSDGDRV